VAERDRDLPRLRAGGFVLDGICRAAEPQEGSLIWESKAVNWLKPCCVSRDSRIESFRGSWEGRAATVHRGERPTTLMGPKCTGYRGIST
jgi:hypothetical protein